MRTRSKAAPILVTRGSFTAKIYPSRKTVSGKAYGIFRLSYHEPGGKRVLKDFADLSRAKAAAADAAASFALARPDAIQFHPDERRDFDAAAHILQPLGIGCYQAAVELADARKLLPPGTTLAQAVADFARRHPANAARVFVPDAVKALLEDRERAKASTVYRLKLATHLDRFATAFKTRLDSVTGPMIGAWLRDLRDEKGKPLGARTVQNYRASVATLFAFGKAQGWVSRDLLDEVREVPVPRAKATAEVGVFDAAQIRTLLHNAPDDIRATLALGAFGMLRTEEIHRLEWRDVRLSERVIVVGADKAKTASRRVIPILPNLALWLAPLVQAGGRVDPSPTAKALVHRWRRIATAAGIQWSHNALRHSCLTFRTAILQNPAQVAFEAGNSAGMIYKHYKALRTEAQAREWFDVVPDTDAGTVLPMEAASRVA